MDYKQKYEEALERARDLHDNHPLGQPQTWTTCEKIFPELRESEDERIRKEIIQFIQDNMCVIHKDKCLAWLEKQGKQKPAWSEEDERMLGKCIDAASGYYSPEDKQSIKDLLESLKDRVQPQPKQELSEEDEKIILSLHHALNCADAQNAVTKTGVEVADVAQWLSDCKERFAKPNHWKPSEEQLRAIINSAQGLYQCKEKEVLLDLYEQLKNL